ncbi:hypothetical protein FGO68_gene7757 [Halteria grandinella]|uniref:Uncharacterized protein n=1 Tax=Halteria grandinella TaxID=5974 RepID=A0A8J8ND94_HALGN|nr:hypothetical protein FGO68_gene7757 [Halteria grandinella]
MKNTTSLKVTSSSQRQTLQVPLNEDSDHQKLYSSGVSSSTVRHEDEDSHQDPNISPGKNDPLFNHDLLHPANGEESTTNFLAKQIKFGEETFDLKGREMAVRINENGVIKTTGRKQNKNGENGVNSKNISSNDLHQPKHTTPNGTELFYQYFYRS